QTVVHPHHGPAVIRGTTSRKLQRKTVKYYDLEGIESNLHGSVPIERAADSGLRPILTRDEIDRVLEVLRAPSEPEVEPWSRRTKENRERLRTGDVYTHAALARDLSRRDQRKRLSFAERQMLREAWDPIAVEVAIALGMSLDDAEALLSSAAQEAVLPVAA